MATALALISGDLVFVVAPQKMPLHHLTLEARRTCIPGSHGTLKIGASS